MSKLNSNIRCIEIGQGGNPTPDRQVWIVTLDVLKSGRNKLPLLRIRPLNSNIRCIEILFSQTLTSFLSRWIVTLDVLKFIEICNIELTTLLNSNIRCIEMYIKDNLEITPYVLNSNIRCIEIMYTKPTLHLLSVE